MNYAAVAILDYTWQTICWPQHFIMPSSSANPGHLHGWHSTKSSPVTEELSLMDLVSSRAGSGPVSCERVEIDVKDSLHVP